jgi:hypothetical protein
VAQSIEVRARLAARTFDATAACLALQARSSRISAVRRSISAVSRRTATRSSSFDEAWSMACGSTSPTGACGERLGQIFDRGGEKSALHGPVAAGSRLSKSDDFLAQIRPRFGDTGSCVAVLHVASFQWTGTRLGVDRNQVGVRGEWTGTR